VALGRVNVCMLDTLIVMAYSALTRYCFTFYEYIIIGMILWLLAFIGPSMTPFVLFISSILLNQ